MEGLSPFMAVGLWVMSNKKAVRRWGAPLVENM